ncbi:MAG TPA: HAD family hydrolase [Micromonosporaceae bacterium]|jgi:putative hydrolase of the HAD superfamily
MVGSFRAVIFDFFGTLTEAVKRGPAHERIALRLGCTPAAFTKALDQTFLMRSVGALGDPAHALAVVAGLAGARPSRTTLESVLAARIAAVRADITLRRDAVPVLATLRRFGLRTGLISDCGPELPEFLPDLAVAEHIEASVFSIEAGCRKPSPRIYEIACRRLGVDPVDCLYIGDGGSQELSGADAVGMTAVRLTAPDLGGHLVFDSDDGWSGKRIDSLTDVFDALTLGRRARVPA